ncbi:MAG: hypothetical protein AW09_000257 [Candidatus Accumulibacter phosphatis]|uniref:Uncharacterized protein n=1 Tax=Candidatus Accumulibacter phosphatis TaxID=327160 RepID=A0A080LZS6_9PROT|nr:MAG: hypothetical protein AW09_000257 [Candidatus Accumulibacter phosphatis]
MKELLRPDHAGQRLAQDAGVLTAAVRLQVLVEDRRFGLALDEDHLLLVEWRLPFAAYQRQFDAHRLSGGRGQHVPRRKPRAGPGGIHCRQLAVDHVTMESVLDIGHRIGVLPQTFGVAFVFAVERLGRLLSIEEVGAERLLFGAHGPLRATGRGGRGQQRFAHRFGGAPFVHAGAP